MESKKEKGESLNSFKQNIFFFFLDLFPVLEHFEVMA